MKKNMLFLFPVMFSFLSCKTAKDLPTVATVDINEYAGQWYEVAKLPNRFEKGLDCVTATYSVMENGKIKVENRGRLLKDLSRFKDITGTAWVPNPEFPGRLKVRFFWPFSGDYYIMALDENYSYALVGSPSRKFLWVLSKIKDLDKDIYDELLQVAKSNGFNIDAVERINQECE